jgi:2-polyprenyl-6-hydroxyphenyl methylase/3-demethylubiquinone-9 3-methyltransferase
VASELTEKASAHEAEVSRGERFEFGKNWSQFLSLLNDKRIEEAEKSLKQMLEVQDLTGKRFLDIGSGSGLFSLAARRLGAAVHSFDFDPHSVACTRELRRRFFDGDAKWTIDEESALNEEYVKSLGEFDVVYSWGVLHHTGQMWRGLENAQMPVRAGGKLFIAIYNDMGSQTTRWRWIKRKYNELPKLLRSPFAAAMIAPEEGKTLLRSLVKLRPGEYLKSWSTYDQGRGMNRWRDIIDWVGGYPYEVARPEEILDFYRAKGFTMVKMKCGGVGLGCNEFVFVRTESSAKGASGESPGQRPG